MKRKPKTFYIIKYVQASSLKGAIRGEENILAVIQKDSEIQQLAEAVGFEFSPLAESDDESSNKLGF